MDYATRTAKQEITEAGKFMVWLEESQHAQIEYLTQEHIDLYWSEGPTTRTVVRNFLLNRKLIGRRKPLHAPKREAMTTPLSTPTERMNALRTVIEADTVKLSTRVAALIFLLYGTEIGRIATLKRDAIAHTPNGMTIELGPLLAPVPEPLLPLFSEYLAANHQGTRSSTDASVWLFPSTQPGRHIQANSLWNRFTIFGIRPQASRNATLNDLTKELDISTLSSMLGYGLNTMAAHAARAGTQMATYPLISRTTPRN
ncbi:hypothetical protein DSM26151_14570 [Agromyces marinus]|nr:hypothetical protein DSM26151_14570 [Agromyces marinus]